MLRRSVSFVYAMRAQGFRMPGGLSTEAAALAFLQRFPYPRTRARRKRKKR